MSRWYFAWVDPEEDEHLPGHERVDEDFIRIEIEHLEGSVASAIVEVRNPRTGLLNPARKVWAAIAVDLGQGAERIFFGRLVGIPEQVHEERIALHFDARPIDFHAQKAALAETLKQLPWYDRVWLRTDELDDPDAALKARPERFHVDRVTHDVTISNIASGEDGTLVITDAMHKRDRLEFMPGDAPSSRVEVEGVVSWLQEATGAIDISNAVRGAFPDGLVASYTGEGLLRNWFSDGQRIGGGWTIRRARLDRTDGVQVAAVSSQGITQTATVVDYRKWTFWPEVVVEYDAARTFIERMRFAVVADVQPVQTKGIEPEDKDPIRLTLQSSHALSEPVPGTEDTDNPDGIIPIGDVRRRQYFVTNRGKQSAEHLMLLARVALIRAARCVEVSASISLADGIGLSCRMNAQIHDGRLPGGQATGKVVGYTLFIDGDAMTEGATVTIGCMVGEGNTVEASPGTPTWVEEGVLEPGIQVYEGQVHVPDAGDIAHPDYSHVTPNDDGIDFFDMRPSQVIEEIEVTGTAAEHEAIIAASHGTMHLAFDALNEAHTQVCIEMVPVSPAGPFETEYDLGDLDLMIPKTIDLAAESSP
jgi:hypothetical protein